MGAGLLSGIIEWAANGFWTLVQHMGVDHDCFYIFVPKQLLHGADVIAGFQQVGGKRVAEGMRGNAFVYAGFLGRRTDSFLDACFVEMMPADAPSFRVE